MPGSSPRFPRKEVAVGVWWMVAFAAIALSVCALPAADPEQPDRGTVDRWLKPLTDLVPGGGPPPSPPAIVDQVAPQVGRAEVSSVATVAARFGYTWRSGDEQVTLIRGSCVIQHDDTTLMADEMIIWQRTTSTGEQLVVYLDGEARLERLGKSVVDPSLVLDLRADAVEFQIAGQLIEQSQADDPVYQRALARRSAGSATSAQGTAFLPVDDLPPDEPSVGHETVALRPTEGRLRRIRIYPRSAIPFNIESVRSTQTIPPEQVTIITGGVNVLIDGFDEQTGLVDLMADRAVIWTQSATESFETEQVQTDDTPFTIYLEGNIVIRQSSGGQPERIVHAERAVYDAREERALMERAELRSFIPELGTDLRVRAEQLRQLSHGRFHALDAWTTTSQFGRPGYRLQSSEVFVEPRYDVNLSWLGAGTTVVDPLTGMEMVETNWVRSYHNTIYVGEVPVMYSPYLAGPAEDIQIPLQQASVGNDSIFGFYAKTAWDPFDLFGFEQPPGVELSLLADYYGKRGPAGGLRGKYRGEDLFGIDDRYRGSGIGYFVHDTGLDRLGHTRNDLEPPTSDRWRLKWRHRHDLPFDAHVNAELGILSDHNMLEQYFKREFDADKDQENLLYATQSLDSWGFGNWSWELLGKAPLNEFETATGWYPKADLWGLSEPLFDGWLTWSSHTSAGYGDIEPADPDDYFEELFFDPLPYAPDVEGATFMTRHQLDMPIPLGPVNIVPFAMGEAAVWEEAIDGSDLSRLTSSVGARASTQFQRIFPQVHSSILGLNGLAHKIRFDAEYRITDTTEPLGAVAQYNEIDDNAQERLRYRLADAYFRGVLPPELDPRYYGVRTGAGAPLGSPYYELVDDQQVVRLAMRQRLQTKSGPPGRMRIRDWMTLDTGVSLFPNPDRDNFGEGAGLIFANYNWMISQRTQIIADAQYDTFDTSQRLWNVGFISQRSRRGSVSLSLRHIEAGAVESDILLGSYSYAMSPKWISTLAGYLDVHDTRNTGESLTLTRVGADFLIHLGVQNNRLTDNVGFTFAVEPRIGRFRGPSTMQLSSLITPPTNP